MSTINIAGVKYTKTSLANKCREIFQRRKGKILKGHDKAIATWIHLQRGKTLHKSTKFAVSDMGRNTGFIYTNDGKVWDTVSYRKALMSDVTEVKKKVRDAFRYAVYDQIKSFRKYQLSLPKNKHLKELAELDPYLVHTDHVIPLHLLLSDFLQGKGMVITDVEFSEVRTGFYKLTDSKLAEDWCCFHKNHAKLKLLTAKENTAKSFTYDIPLYRYNLATGKTYDTKQQREGDNTRK